MRILLYCINFSPELTGIGKYTGEMAEWLVERGHKVRVVTAPPYYPEWKIKSGHSRRYYMQSFTENLKVFRCPIYVPANPSGQKRLLHLISFAVSSLPVIFSQILWKPELIFVVEPTLLCALQAHITAVFSGATSWLHIQDFEVDAAFELNILSSRHMRKLASAFECWLMHRFNVISSISRCMVERAERKCPGKQAVLFPNWVSTKEIFPLDGSKIGKGAVVALYSGNLGRKQGLETIIAAAKILCTSHPNIKFVLCGEGSEKEKLVALAEGTPQIEFHRLAPASELNRSLNVADIHLLPQHGAAADLVMPSKLTGIFASGKPVVATALPDTELGNAVQGRGICVPPGDADAFAAAIVRLAEDANLRHQLGNAAREYAMKHLDRDTVLSNFEKRILACANPPQLSSGQ